MKSDTKAGPGPAHNDARVLAALGFGPDSVLMNEPKLFVDGRFLSSLLKELEGELGPDGAREALFQIGASHGMRDAQRMLTGHWIAESDRGVPHLYSSTTLVMTLSAPRMSAERLEIHGEWPERHEAEARLARLGRADSASCRLSAGYTSGWLTATRETDVIAIETECAAAGAAACRFRALDAASFAEEYGGAATPSLPAMPLGVAPIEASSAEALHTAAPRSVTPEFDPDEEAIHVWGPVMVLPVREIDESLRALEMLAHDPSLCDVRVVVLDLGQRPLDDDLGAAGLEHMLRLIETWGAESILAGVAPTCEHIVAELEASRLLTRKELPDAIAAAFQIAEAQRHVL
ncbi:MAG: hypothetical protein JRG92_05870 [Deltaproteobacteria bacterium]|nr:hypothetical protein [Deltaproteobacteria bacterium]MBW2383141.1 hypothetical protein [Deltaproteobacteria bacterium]